MTKNKALILLAVAAFLGFTISLPRPTLSQSASDPGNNNELMEQGKIRTCLSAKFNNIPEGRGVEKVTGIRLTGTCASPTGCKCVMTWGVNNGVAWLSDDEGFDEECGNFSDEEKVKGNKRLNRCNKGRREAGNPILAAIKPGFKACNIVKNNLASANNGTSGNNILGESTNGIIPPGPVDIMVSETTYIHTPVDFSAVGDLAAEIITSDLGTGGEEIDGEDPSQKLSTMEFFAEKLEVNVEDLETKCTSITWDPYGRVFDSRSLEPIMDVEVTLIDEATKQPAFMEFNDNYDITGQDGLFNIQVEKEGYFSMRVDAEPLHNFITSPILSPYWSKIYSDLYYPEDSFFEKSGVPTHHDIPVMSKGEPYRGAVALVVPGTLKSQSIGEHIVYSGRQTFPMAKVCLVDEETGRVVGKCVNANNVGRFTIALEKSVAPSSKLVVKAEKVDLNNPDLYKPAQAVENIHTNSIYITKKGTSKLRSFEPILSHVEGYVYDSKGAVIPNATVNVKLKSNDELFYETKADDSGFFTIYANDLPYIEYYFEFTNPETGEVITKSSSEFVLDNGDYLGSQDINLMTAVKNNQPIVNPATGQLNQFDNSGLAPNDEGAVPTGRTTPKNIGIIIVAFVLVVLVIAAAGILIYIKRQNKFVP